MKITDKDDEIMVDFDTNERETLLKIIGNSINYRTKTDRKQFSNWCFVSDLTDHGSTYSRKICEALGVDPSGNKWENSTKKQKEI